jgi:hypothetical protein
MAMPRVFKPLHFCVVVAAGLVLASSARAQAPKVKAAPIAFRNQSNMNLIVEGVSIIDGQGNLKTLPIFNPKVAIPVKPEDLFKKPAPLSWTIKAGEYVYLQDGGNKIYAVKFTAKVHASGKVSEWLWTSNGPDGNGYFTAAFTQDNLRHHLGEKVVVQQPQAGPTQEQQLNAVAKIVAAALAQALAEKVVKDARAAGREPALGEVLAVGLAKTFRDAAIKSAIQDLFPRVTPRQSGGIQGLISGAIDGRLNYQNKNQVIDDLRRIDQDLGDLAVIADFIYATHQASRKR